MASWITLSATPEGDGEGECPTAKTLPVLAAERHLFLVWLLLLFASEDAAVLCHCSRADGRCTLGIFSKQPPHNLLQRWLEPVTYKLRCHNV